MKNVSDRTGPGRVFIKWVDVELGRDCRCWISDNPRQLSGPSHPTHTWYTCISATQNVKTTPQNRSWPSDELILSKSPRTHMLAFVVRTITHDPTHPDSLPVESNRQIHGNSLYLGTKPRTKHQGKFVLFPQFLFILYFVCTLFFPSTITYFYGFMKNQVQWQKIDNSTSPSFGTTNFHFAASMRYKSMFIVL